MSNPYGAPPPPPNQPTADPHQTLASARPPDQRLTGVPHRLATAAIWLAVALTVIMVATAVTSYPVSVTINDMAAGAATSTSAWIWFGTSVVVAFALFAVLGALRSGMPVVTAEL